MLLSLIGYNRPVLLTSKQRVCFVPSAYLQTLAVLRPQSCCTPPSQSVRGAVACRSTAAPKQLSNPLGCSLRLGNPTDLDRSSVEALYSQVRCLLFTLLDFFLPQLSKVLLQFW